ncbi:ABC transporter, partial [Ectothiorhodospiraceae bacterium WFHF3C12]|nr:ABC transporter [Ectothiorhodospiraceae bacterium WFHF3C12]
DAGAAAGTREQRVAVVGDGDFLSNSYLGNGGNLPFGLNLLQWLLASDTLLETYQPATPDQRLAFTRTGQAVTGLGFLLALPVLLAAIGGWRWWRLRRG